jgi:hypothetical protein
MSNMTPTLKAKMKTAPIMATYETYISRGFMGVISP